MLRRHAYWYPCCSRPTSECGQAPGQAQPGALPTRLPPSHPPLSHYTHHRPIPLHPSHYSHSASSRTLTLTHMRPARNPPSRDAAYSLHPHLHPNQARVTVARSIAIVSQLRHPSRSARAVDARAAASQPTEPASARAVPGIPSRPPPEPPPEQQPALSMHSGGSCASCRCPSRRRPRQPQPWSCPRPPLCLRQGPVCPPFFSPLRGGLGSFRVAAPRTHQKNGR